MYIAFKWLVFLAFVMWVTICIIDFLFIKESTKMRNTGGQIKESEINFKNISMKIKNKSHETKRRNVIIEQKSKPDFHIIMFIAGALAVAAFQNTQEILTFVQQKITLFHVAINNFIKKIPPFKKTAINLRLTISKSLLYIWEKLKNATHKMFDYIHFMKVTQKVKQNKIHIILLNKLKEMGEERKSLGQLLISAIHENKNIRMRYQLETMTKNRLTQHIENTQKQVKENRSKYMSFHQLYLVTHQENSFLKACLEKLRQEKNEAERNLTGLINEVYKSKQRELIAYCSRFLVKTKDKLLNCDVNAEIKEFLENSRGLSEATPRSYSSKQIRNEVFSRKSWLNCSNTRVTDILNEDDCLVPHVSDVPKLKGLPGEYVWTVKDKDGIIEKLYEYNYETDFDNGDTIRRIRQYSVYFDKDCLLDFSRMERESNTETSCSSSRTIILDNPLGIQRIVTGSELFQKFLQSHNAIAASPLLRR